MSHNEKVLVMNLLLWENGEKMKKKICKNKKPFTTCFSPLCRRDCGSWASKILSSWGNVSVSLSFSFQGNVSFHFQFHFGNMRFFSFWQNLYPICSHSQLILHQTEEKTNSSLSTNVNHLNLQQILFDWLNFIVTGRNKIRPQNQIISRKKLQ